MLDCDVLIVGAGAIGTATAWHLARAGHHVTVLEKEPGPALHQSGRNSGVIHAGYNLKPGSNKARFCVEGAARLKAYCAEKGIRMVEGGILVVARTEEERGSLAELARRSAANGVDAKLLDRDALREVEPHADGVEALHAPGGASFDARAFVHALSGDALASGAEFLYDTRVLRVDDATLGEGAAQASGSGRSRPTKVGRDEDPGHVEVHTTKGPLRAKVLVNAAGLYADRLARGLAGDVRVIPFRGYYAELRPQRRDLVLSHVYAAPDLRFPFLGVHLSRRVDGRVIVGPGAMLAFGREAYGFWSLKGGGLGSTLTWPGLWRLFKEPRFRRLVTREVAKSLRVAAIADEARLLVPELGRGDLVRSYAGNRAQQVWRDGRLVEDILVRETRRGVHVLNAVSPGLTTSLAFGDDVAARAAARL